ncbi:MAG: RNA repair transcriptional activator RtcR [Blastocatellia bacterium]
MAKDNVIIGLLGPVKDGGGGPERWERWRPTVALCQHEDFLVKRMELISQPEFAKLAKIITGDIAAVSPETEVRITEITLKDAWDFEEVYGLLHDFARQYKFRPEKEEYLIHISTGSHVEQICLFLLTEAKYFPGRLLQSSPPRRRRDSAYGSYDLIDLDLSRYDRLASRFQKEQKDSVSFLKSGIETRNGHFNKLIDRIEQVAINSREPLLFIGPTGAGKSRLARRIFELKKNRHQVKGDFIETNCATIRGDAAMSALFGHVKGAFTGAMRDRPGLLRAADGGVLFLDEIGELGRDEQAMLLRALEEKRFTPLGSDKEVRSDFQLIAGTNRDLAARVREGQFREDLLARINLWTFFLPGLRDRVEDIEPNLDYELEQYAVRNSNVVTFSREARARFLKFATSPEARWTGNFRDLNGAVTRMATLAGGGRISSDVAGEEIERLRVAWAGAETRGDESLLAELLMPAELAAIDLFDRYTLAGVVRLCREAPTLSDAGRRLFQSSRDRKATANDADRLRKFLARFGLDWRRVRGGG